MTCQLLNTHECRGSRKCGKDCCRFRHRIGPTDASRLTFAIIELHWESHRLVEIVNILRFFRSFFSGALTTMQALILAAGIGWRLGGGPRQLPKSLLKFGGKTLIRRHLEILAACGVSRITVGVGYRADTLRAEIAKVDLSVPVVTEMNQDYRLGNIVTLWTLREGLRSGGPVLLMDADVLYDQRLMQRLVGSENDNCFLLDRNVEPGEEPVKLCVRDNRLVEFRKRIDSHLEFDFSGESIGFFKLSEVAANELADRAGDYIRRGLKDEYYEEAIRDLLLDPQGPTFGFEDVTGLPWVEIDFPEDVRRAEAEVLPKLAVYEATRHAGSALKAADGV